MSPTMTRVLIGVLAVIGILAIVAGVIYIVEPARDLPSFFPGALDKSSPYHFHRKHRGDALFVVGVLFVIGSVALAIYDRRSRR